MTQNIPLQAQNGWACLVKSVLFFLVTIGCFVGMGFAFEAREVGLGIALLVVSIFATAGSILYTAGFFTVQPNQARLIVLFGEYLGTATEEGFFWANPFARKHLLSMRSRNLDGQRLKVNDKRGNPIEIAAAAVWKVTDPARAFFNVENFEDYVRVQSEAALRHLANSYPYDHGEEGEITLRHVEEVSAALKVELQERFEKAGVTVEEARLTHIAYAAEIAGAMLRRQQAEAIIAARQKIVEGAVSMVQMAIEGLEKRGVVELDVERKAAMVSNLLVVLCGESEAQPVVNAGTLHH